MINIDLTSYRLQTKKYKTLVSELHDLNGLYLSRDKSGSARIVEIVKALFAGEDPLYAKTQKGMIVLAYLIGIILAATLYVFVDGIGAMKLIGTVLLCGGIVYWIVRSLHKKAIGFNEQTLLAYYDIATSGDE